MTSSLTLLGLGFENLSWYNMNCKFEDVFTTRCSLSLPHSPTVAGFPPLKKARIGKYLKFLRNLFYIEISPSGKLIILASGTSSLSETSLMSVSMSTLSTFRDCRRQDFFSEDLFGWLRSILMGSWWWHPFSVWFWTSSLSEVSLWKCIATRWWFGTSRAWW